MLRFSRGDCAGAVVQQRFSGSAEVLRFSGAGAGDCAGAVAQWWCSDGAVMVRWWRGAEVQRCSGAAVPRCRGVDWVQMCPGSVVIVQVDCVLCMLVQGWCRCKGAEVLSGGEEFQQRSWFCR